MILMPVCGADGPGCAKTPRDTKRFLGPLAPCVPEAACGSRRSRTRGILEEGARIPPRARAGPGHPAAWRVRPGARVLERVAVLLGARRLPRLPRQLPALHVPRPA